VIQTAVDGARQTLTNGNAVLVVDDDTDLRESLGEALDLLPGLNRPCAVLLDMAMPVMNGTEFYRAMRAVPALADIRVGILTCDPSLAPSGLPRMKKTSLDRLLTMVGGLF
jgi:PleD family two-component response regulator